MGNAWEGRFQRGKFPRDEYLTLWDRSHHVLAVPCSAKGRCHSLPGLFMGTACVVLASSEGLVV